MWTAETLRPDCDCGTRRQGSICRPASICSSDQTYPGPGPGFVLNRTVQSAPLSHSGGQHQLRVWLDTANVEIFVDGRIALTTLAFPTRSDSRCVGVVGGGDARSHVAFLSVWTLRAAPVTGVPPTPTQKTDDPDSRALAAQCSYLEGDADSSGKCRCDAGWRGTASDVLDERPTPPTVGYSSSRGRTTWLGSVMRRPAGDFALFVDIAKGEHCSAGQAYYFIVDTGICLSPNPLGPFAEEPAISPLVTMHPTPTLLPTGETTITMFTDPSGAPTLPAG